MTLLKFVLREIWIECKLFVKHPVTCTCAILGGLLVATGIYLDSLPAKPFDLTHCKQNMHNYQCRIISDGEFVGSLFRIEEELAGMVGYDYSVVLGEIHMDFQTRNEALEWIGQHI